MNTETCHCEECGEEFPNMEDGNIYCSDCGDRCSDCGEEFLKEKLTTNADGQMICEECLDESYFYCEDCGKWHYMGDSAMYSYNDTYLCGKCYDYNYITCEDCGVVVRYNESYINGNDDRICEHCYENDYFCCDDCGGIFHNDYYGNDGYCQNCERERSSHSDYVHNYSYTPSTYFHGDNKLPFYGMELETDNYRDKENAAEQLSDISECEDQFYMKEDGSLSNDGIEIVFHPRTCQAWLDYDLKTLVKTVRRHGGKSFDATGNSCGIHIHRSKKDLSIVSLTKLTLFFGKCAHEITKLAQRKSDYASFEFFEDNASHGKCLTYGCIKKSGHKAERYQAINFQNNQTIEFRIFKGTLKEESIYAYIAFCDYVTSYCKASLLSDMLDGDKLWKGFMGYVKLQKGTMADNFRTYLKTKELI